MSIFNYFPEIGFMKNTCLLALFLLLYTCSSAQLMRKQPVGKSGCELYAFGDMKFSESFSPDSSTVYTGENVSNDSLHWGIICVKLNPAAVIADAEAADQLLSSYLDFLKTALDIKSAVGYGRGHSLPNQPTLAGIIDYWQSAEGNEWKVNGWITKKYIAVLYVRANGKLTESEKVNLFLNGIRFPSL